MGGGGGGGGGVHWVGEGEAFSRGTLGHLLERIEVGRRGKQRYGGAFRMWSRETAWPTKYSQAARLNTDTRHLVRVASSARHNPTAIKFVLLQLTRHSLLASPRHRPTDDVADRFPNDSLVEWSAASTVVRVKITVKTSTDSSSF